MTGQNNSNLGRLGEQKAAEYYMEIGYRLIAKNFQYYRQGVQGRMGEIDLIMMGEDILCFIEVKTRSDNRFGTPAEQISPKKLKHIFKTFQYFLLKYPQYRHCPMRFDVAEVLPDKINIIPNAYNFDDFWKI